MKRNRTAVKFPVFYNLASIFMWVAWNEGKSLQEIRRIYTELEIEREVIKRRGWGTVIFHIIQS